MVYVLIIAVIIFLFILLFIYRQEVVSFLKSKLKISKKDKQKPQKSESQQKKEQTIKYEDFVPKNKNSEKYEEMDSSLKELLKPTTAYNQPSQQNENVQSENFENDINFDEEIKNHSSLDFLGEYTHKTNKKSISKKIKDLPPEVKALIFDGTLMRKDEYEILSENLNKKTNKQNKNDQ